MLEFKTIEDVYNAFDQVGCCSFATLDGAGGVESRIAHFFAWDEEGLYLRTMDVKPFYRQLVEGGKLSVCGERCDECGNCYNVCPAGAVIGKGVA